MIATDTAAYRWSAIGGDLALDLCNTTSWRLDPVRDVERLADPRALVDWYCSIADGTVRSALEEDLAAHPRRAEAALGAVRAIRHSTIALIDAHLDDTDVLAADLDVVSQAWQEGLAVADVAPVLPLSSKIKPTTLPLLAAHLGLAVGRFLHGPDVAAVGRCDGDGCGWLFLDTTRNHSRRWCDSSDCGNRARVRSYVQRRRASRAG